MKKLNNWSGRRTMAWGRSDIHPAFFRELLRFEVPTHEESLAYCRVVQTAVRRLLAVGPGEEIKFDGVDYRAIIKRLRKSEREAFDQMVVRNLRMVLVLAKQFAHGSMSDADLVGFGIEGMMVAVLRFDPGRDIRFSTYATWWIRHHIGRAIADHGFTVRMPVHMHDTRKRVDKARAKVAQNYGREATCAELAQTIKVSEDWLSGNLSRLVSVFSLNAKVDHDGYEIEYQDMTPDETVRNPADEAIANLDTAKLQRAMAEVLDARERAVLYLHFHGELTLKEIGENSVGSVQEGRRGRGLSRERIRQIQDMALRKLRIALTENDPDPEVPVEEEPSRNPARRRYLRPKGYSYLH